MLSATLLMIGAQIDATSSPLAVDADRGMYIIDPGYINCLFSSADKKESLDFDDRFSDSPFGCIMKILFRSASFKMPPDLFI